MRKIALILLITLLVGIACLEAQTTGKLAVRARDSQGRALEFVNIVVMSGSQMITGGQTNEKGQAVIINIPPGVYVVKLSLMGYAPMEFHDVRIQVGQTNTISPTMTSKDFMGETVVVTQTIDRVGKDRTETSRQIEMERFSETSATNLDDILAIQAGFTMVGGELHVRGSRANEVNYTVDGMSVSDPVDGGSSLSVDPDAIKDMKVMTGGFPAEFGNAQSGVINIVTKDGDSFFSGKVEYNTDHLFGTGRNKDVFKFAIGGPIVPFADQSLKERLTFYLNGGGEWLDGKLRKFYISNPNEDFEIGGRTLLSENYATYNPYKDRSSILGIDVGNRNYNAYNVNLKTKFDLNPTQKFTFGVRGDRDFNFPFSYGWRYALQHYAFTESIQKQYIATYDHVFNNTMNIKLKGSYYTKDYYNGPRGIDRKNYMSLNPHAADDPDKYIEDVLKGNYGYQSVDYDGDGVYDVGFHHSNKWSYNLESQENPRTVPGFNPPGTIYQNFIDDNTTTVNFRTDFEWQVNQTHLAKTGFEVISNNIKKNQLNNFLTIYEDRRQAYLRSIYDINNYDLDNWGTDNQVPIALFALESIAETPESVADLVPIYKPEDYYAAAKASSGKRDGYNAQPWQLAYYLQDKMDWEGMIINAGMRFDFWYLGSSYDILQDNGKYVSRDFDKKDRFQMMISPRLGVSHPITERDVLRFAYNYQNQLPQMQYIFTSKTPEDANLSDVTITVGNPKLEPQITVTYEVGLSHQLSEDYVLDMTAYYKNLYNYVSTVKERKEGEESVHWYRFISEDYGSARGIDIQMEKILSNFNTWTLAYSLAWANGNNSSTVIQDENTSYREFPLDWDVRHNVSMNYTFRIGKGEEFFIPFTYYILPVDDISASLTWSLTSGAPYTPQSQEGNSMLDTNSKRMKASQGTDLRISKGISLPGNTSARVFFDVENLFKNTQIYSVYPKTGKPWESGEDLVDPIVNYVYPEVAFMHAVATRNPSHINNYRGITVGISFNF